MCGNGASRGLCIDPANEMIEVTFKSPSGKPMIISIGKADAEEIQEGIDAGQ